MSADMSKYLADPKPGMTLDELARELNQLAKIRDNARLAFCKRLAVVYMMIVGHRPARGAPNDGSKFYSWCEHKIRSATGKRYTKGSLGQYLRVGFAKNPEAFMRERDVRSNEHASHVASVGWAIKRAIATETPPKVIPITKLKQQGMPTDVAREVNYLMTAWEQASAQARTQFIYIVTGKRIAA